MFFHSIQSYIKIYQVWIPTHSCFKFGIEILNENLKQLVVPNGNREVMEIGLSVEKFFRFLYIYIFL